MEDPSSSVSLLRTAIGAMSSIMGRPDTAELLLGLNFFPIMLRHLFNDDTSDISPRAAVFWTKTLDRIKNSISMLKMLMINDFWLNVLRNSIFQTWCFPLPLLFSSSWKITLIDIYLVIIFPTIGHRKNLLKFLRMDEERKEMEFEEFDEFVTKKAREWQMKKVKFQRSMTASALSLGRPSSEASLLPPAPTLDGSRSRQKSSSLSKKRKMKSRTPSRKGGVVARSSAKKGHAEIDAGSDAKLPPLDGAAVATRAKELGEEPLDDGEDGKMGSKRKKNERKPKMSGLGKRAQTASSKSHAPFQSSRSKSVAFATIRDFKEEEMHMPKFKTREEERLFLLAMDMKYGL
eukprot:TRINITY_DN4630_c0_g1_i2.p1 TRINITY_DN4630_c0_g1~~TRINITY_DN4630_c0_g1_i2.p1  ORF type:complete len:384 (+),score=110.35 TRINITY_DN4630_c0_g1_i2:112-1152(+)